MHKKPGLAQVLLLDAKASLWTQGRVGWPRAVYHWVRSPKYRLVVRLRLSQFLYSTRTRVGRVLAFYFYHRNLKFVDIHPGSKIGAGVRIAHPLGIVIGSDVVIGDAVRIQQGVTIGGSLDRKVVRDGKIVTMPVVGDNCLIGPGACVLGPIDIGNGVLVGANAVVAKSVPSGAKVLAGRSEVRLPSVDGFADQEAVEGRRDL